MEKLLIDIPCFCLICFGGFSAFVGSTAVRFAALLGGTTTFSGYICKRARKTFIMTVTRDSVGAFNIVVYTCTYFCCYFSWVANISSPLLRWRQKLRCSSPRFTIVAQLVKYVEDGLHGANSCFNGSGDSHWQI